MALDLSKLPKERLASLYGIANALWRTAYAFGGDKGDPPTLAELSYRNRKRWIGAAFAAESLIAQAKQDAVQQRAVINMCITALEDLRDKEDHVEIK